jgi:hypothetical protein
MSAPATPAVPAPSPVSWILLVLNAALAGLAIVEPGDAALVKAFTTIIQSAMAAYQQNTGKPIDLTQIPIETPVP